MDNGFALVPGKLGHFPPIVYSEPWRLPNVSLSPPRRDAANDYLVV
jgi:hypothetical protein